MSSSTGFRLLVPCALALYFASGCLPDLDSLSAEYSATAGASGGSNPGGGMDSGGGGGSVPTAACENGKQDSNESDVDCGGTSRCDRCAEKSKCTANRDCDSALFCGKDSHCTVPTCRDDVQNQDETAIDCGGSCPACDIGIECGGNMDCTGRYCKDGVCADHCESKVVESDETDQDCGGSCDPCADKKHCLEAEDCQSRVCSNNKCLPASCSDEVKNQDESDTDCGGVCAAMKPCPVSAHCKAADDCESWICSAAGKCVADITVLAKDLLDDFEDGDFNLPPNNPPAPAPARVGNWYAFSDMTGTSSFNVVTIGRGASHMGFETKGKDYQKWGSGVGVDMATAKAPYDASAYIGLTFWARAETALTVTVVFPDAETDKGGGLCTTCDHHYNKTVSVGTTWQRYTVNFADLVLEPDTVPTPGPFLPNGIISVQFRMLPGTTYDVYLDDVAFIPKPKP